MPSPVWSAAQRIKAQATLKARYEARLAEPVRLCACGRVVWIRRHGLCKPCYHIAWRKDAL